MEKHILSRKTFCTLLHRSMKENGLAHKDFSLYVSDKVLEANKSKSRNLFFLIMSVFCQHFKIQEKSFNILLKILKRLHVMEFKENVFASEEYKNKLSDFNIIVSKKQLNNLCKQYVKSDDNIDTLTYFVIYGNPYIYPRFENYIELANVEIKFFNERMFN